jgi:hypothetical protein
MLRSAALAALAALTVLTASACEGAPLPSPPPDAAPEAGPACTTPFAGQRGAGAQIEVITLGPGQAVNVVEDGATVPLIFPPQGGRVIFAGVRATNLDPCAVTLAGALRDEATMEVRVDTRTVNLVPASGGWVESDPTDASTFSNIPVCPNEWSATDLYGAAYQLVITVTDSGGETATKTLEVHPTCAEPDNLAECLCICMAGYVLGQSCADAGAPDGGS